MKTLDISNRQNLIHNQNGIGIPKTAVPVLLVFALVSLLLTIKSLWGIIPSIIFIGALTNRTGNYIDFDKKQIGHYSSFFGFKFGEWKGISRYDRITLLKTKKGSRISSVRSYGVVGYNTYDFVYEINLVNSKTLNEIYIAEFENKEEAEGMLKEYMTKYGYEYINRIKAVKERRKRTNKK